MNASRKGVRETAKRRHRSISTRRAPAELTAMLHVLAEPGHHPQLAGWAGGVWAGLRPELAERLREAEFLWRSSRADFLALLNS